MNTFMGWFKFECVFGTAKAVTPTGHIVTEEAVGVRPSGLFRASIIAFEEIDFSNPRSR